MYCGMRIDENGTNTNQYRNNQRNIEGFTTRGVGLEDDYPNGIAKSIRHEPRLHHSQDPCQWSLTGERLDLSVHFDFDHPWLNRLGLGDLELQHTIVARSFDALL